MVQIVVFDRDGEPVLTYVGWQALWHGPRPKGTVLFEPKVEVRTRFTMVVENEDGTDDHTSIVRYLEPQSSP